MRQNPANFSFIAYGRDDIIFWSWADGRYARPLDLQSPALIATTPRWSPDGTMLAYRTRIEFDSELPIGEFADVIEIVDLKGREVRQIAGDWNSIRSFDGWSPDGKSLLLSAGYGRHIDLVRLDVKSRSVHHLTDQETDETSPVWSPDGRWIVFTAANDGESSVIYRIQADGSGLISVTVPTLHAQFPVWSRDGQWILFTVQDETFDLYRIQPDGSDLEQLTHTGRDRCCALMSPDGAWVIALGVERTGSNREIYLMRPDGSDSRALTHSYIGTPPRWSPDSQWIYFGLDGDLIRIRVDGSERQRLTTDRDSVMVDVSPPIDLPFRIARLVVMTIIGLAAAIILRSR